ncbi:MAG TPA: diguanylate cyclase [Gemmatimonadales bacterium]|nr:diguanylate cyclase [Gemmatimonadales bacterium]
MSDPVDDIFLDLQREYLAELPDRLDEIRRDIAAFAAGDPDAAASLRTRFHRLAGSGGSYGFPELSTVAREAELWIAGAPPAAEASRLEEALERLAAAARRAGGGPVAHEAAGEDGTTGGRWRARLILPNGPEREQLSMALADAGYEVQLGSRKDDPDVIPAAYRPDLVVIGLGAGEGDPSAVASRWTGGRARPQAVVLVETLRAVDRLRAGAAGVDAVFQLDRMTEDLPRYARVLTRIGAPPGTVLLVEADAERAGALADRLAEANIRVVRTPLASAVQELLDREVPDLLLLETRLADGDGAAVARMIRQDRRFAHMPLVFLGSGAIEERVEALRAGGDDFLAHPVDGELLLQTVVARAQRGRRLREALHRDVLTGLLNHHTLMAELEYAVDYCRKHGDPLSLVVFDLDRFGEVNERFGQMVGDQVLLHVANVFRANVRASDVIGRYGGEEFAMVLRGGTAEGAAVLAAKLRRVLGEQAATTAEGVIIPLYVSVGWAAYPADGTTAGELAHAAARALRKEKSEKG